MEQGPIPITEDSPPYRPPGVGDAPRGDVDEEFFVSCDAAGVRYTTTLYVRELRVEAAHFHWPGG